MVLPHLKDDFLQYHQACVGQYKEDNHCCNYLESCKYDRSLWPRYHGVLGRCLAVRTSHRNNASVFFKIVTLVLEASRASSTRV